jgi:hypothetical protein
MIGLCDSDVSSYSPNLSTKGFSLVDQVADCPTISASSAGRAPTALRHESLQHDVASACTDRWVVKRPDGGPEIRYGIPIHT